MSTVVENDCHDLRMQPSHHTEPFAGTFERYLAMAVGRIAEYANVDAKRGNNH